jgi:hypothetical protein
MDFLEINNRKPASYVNYVNKLLTGSNDNFCKLMHQLNHMLQLIFYNLSKCVLKIRLTRENYSHDFFRKNSASPRA